MNSIANDKSGTNRKSILTKLVTSEKNNLKRSSNEEVKSPSSIVEVMINYENDENTKMQRKKVV
jgi:hypothetical protein